MRFDPTFLLFLPVCVFSIVAHECAHGLAALACGDATARDRGRLTLNPIPHVDPLGSLVLPAILLLVRSPIVFGWARPMPVNPANLRDLRNDPVKVALAGPAANFILAILCAALARLSPASGFLAPLRDIALAGVVWNCALGLFNLIPIPPLDGSWVLMRFLRLRHIIALHHFRLVGIVLVALLVASPLSGRLFFHGPLRVAVHACLGLFGVADPGLGL